MGPGSGWKCWHLCQMLGSLWKWISSMLGPDRFFQRNPVTALSRRGAQSQAWEQGDVLGGDCHGVGES